MRGQLGHQAIDSVGQLFRLSLFAPKSNPWIAAALLDELNDGRLEGGRIAAIRSDLGAREPGGITRPVFSPKPGHRDVRVTGRKTN